MAELSTRDLHPLRGLDGLRFIGSFVLLAHHIERIKQYFGLPTYRNVFFSTGFGHASMTLFFVISGFLITYLLLREKKATGTVSIKAFYVRRIFRIWPVYYLVLILFTFVLYRLPLFQLPSVTSGKDPYFTLVLTLYFFHLSNFQMFFALSIKPLLFYWSLAVEEQFYAFWPWLIKRSRQLLKIFLLVIIVKVGLKLGVGFANHFVVDDAHLAWLKKVELFLFYLRFEAFGCGGIAAWLLVMNHSKALSLLYKPVFRVFNWILLLIALPLNNYTEFSHVVFSFCFSVIILNMVSNPQNKFLLENPVTDYIGKISYGIYMFQVPVLIALTHILYPNFSAWGTTKWNLVLYLTGYACVLVVAIISYELMEKRIIRKAHSISSRMIYGKG